MHIAIIGGGIVGTTAAFYLQQAGHHVTLCDDSTGQATSAAAGIICPWFSQRRNRVWYHLARTGAAFYRQLLDDLQAEHIATDWYRQTGTIILKRTKEQADKLLQLARSRQVDSPEMGALRLYTPEELRLLVPPLRTADYGLFASGGAVIDGQQFVHTIQTWLNATPGCTVLHQRVQHLDWDDQQQTLTLADGTTVTAERTIVATGAWLPELLSPHGYTIDIRPQKGQLFSCRIPTHQQSADWPVIMPQHEIDLLPFPQGKWVIGATHENDAGYHLTPDPDLLVQMQQLAAQWLPELAECDIATIRVGTRAYTSDFTPFFGSVPGAPQLFVASGLGSSGLTTGPLIGYCLSCMIAQLPTPISPDLAPVSSYMKQTL